MLTLKEDPENICVCEMGCRKNKTKVFWHPKKKEELRNAIDNLDSFNTAQFRDKFELSRLQASDIFEHLKNDCVCERYQKKYFKCKEHIQNSLMTEMNIEDQNASFVINFPPGTGYCAHHLIIGGTGAGKTHTCVQKILNNLKGPKKDRRDFIYFSAEWNRDATLSKLKDKRFSEHVDGVDCSEDGLKDSQWNTPEEFFLNEIKLRCDFAKKTVICFDDAMDMCCSPYIKPLINRMMRVARHQDVSLCVLLHCIRSASWSSQSHQSCKYITLFPRSQKGKIRDFLNSDIGCSLSEAREIVQDFGQTGREMTMSLHCPQFCMNENLIRLL